MKKLILPILLFIAMTTNAQTKITVDKIPATAEEFILLRDKIGNTPEGGAVAFVVATIMYSKNAQMGRQAIIIQSDKKLLEASTSNKSYKGFALTSSNDFLVGQLDSKKYIPGSYVVGTSNANGYEIGAGPYNFTLTTNQYSKGTDGSMKIFVACTGADTPRPVTLIQNDKGIWKAKEYSSLFVGVKAPVVKSKGATDGDF